MPAPDNSKQHVQPAPRRKYVRAVSPRLLKVLYVVFALFALIAANSTYLASITFLNWVSDRWGNGLSYENLFYMNMFMLHLVLGALLLIPFLVFGLFHMKAARNRRNRRAIWMGYAVFVAGCVVLVTGILLVRVEGLVDLKHGPTRRLVYWLHAIGPLVAVWLYCLHRLAGPRIKWRLGLTYSSCVIAIVGVMVLVQAQDPRDWFAVGSKEGLKYFEPSLARTARGNFIPADTLMMDEYCMKCHQDVYDGWYHSVHHFSSFNNPAYLASVRETREVALRRDGNVKASRWCAGCHDPVPFFSGAFDNPNFDDVNDPRAHAGITCTACHAITNINSARGNADYTIEEPLHYPFAKSDNTILQSINNTLVKAKPDFHKQMFLKPFHKTSEFCSVCHKVHLPKEVTHYKDFLRGQNHYDSYLLSGVSGVGARSFYYPPHAEHNCNGCHMPLQPSADFGAKLFAGTTSPSVHDHLFPSANTALAWLRNEPDIIRKHQDFLKGSMRVDLFGIKTDGRIDGELIAPLRPALPTLVPGQTYLLETVVRTLKMGHLFTQGTADSNQVWLEVRMRSGGHTIGVSGAINDVGAVDPWSHFFNVFMLDRNGNRINRRNAQDIFVPLYNHQIPPGAAQVVHYSFTVPETIEGPISVEVKLNYRKFDQEFANFFANTTHTQHQPIRGYTPGQPYVDQFPITVLASDHVEFPVANRAGEANNTESAVATWERWNDYGIGLLLKGTAELRQAGDAFHVVEEMNRYDGAVNLARVLFREGRLDEAVEAINRARQFDAPAAPDWTLAWLSGQINRQQGYLEIAAQNFHDVLETRTAEMLHRGFDFGRDYVVRNQYGGTLFDLAKQQVGGDLERRQQYLKLAMEQFKTTLKTDPENAEAHFNLQQLHSRLGNDQLAQEHQKLHLRYKPDDNARDQAIALARARTDARYAAANAAAEDVVIYPLQRQDAPGWETTSTDNHPLETHQP